jgi:hypothetical protein
LCNTGCFLQEQLVVFSIDEAPPVVMRIPLPHRVDHETATAKYSRKKQQLKLTMSLR